MKYKITLFGSPIIISCILIAVVRRVDSNFLLYETIVFSIACSLLFTALVSYKQRPAECDKSRYILTLLLSGSIAYNLYFSTLMNIDRSKSFYVIQWIAEMQPTNLSDLQSEIVKKYGYFDSESILKRISEQQKRGIITDTEFLYLTGYGEIYYYIANVTAKVFNLNGWSDAKILKNN